MADNDRVMLFVSHTGTVHYATDYQWGPGPECSSRFIAGTLTDGLESTVTCQRCVTNHLPLIYEVRVPDKRTKVGYRVEHTAEDFAEAERLLLLSTDKAYIEETKVSA